MLATAVWVEAGMRECQRNAFSKGLTLLVDTPVDDAKAKQNDLRQLLQGCHADLAEFVVVMMDGIVGGEDEGLEMNVVATWKADVSRGASSIGHCQQGSQGRRRIQ